MFCQNCEYFLSTKQHRKTSAAQHRNAPETPEKINNHSHYLGIQLDQIGLSNVLKRSCRILFINSMEVYGAILEQSPHSSSYSSEVEL